MASPRETPAMQQYYRFKKRHPGCVLMFRIGDFYEMFDEDAVAVSKAIGLTLTQRSEGVPMAGVPFHQLETYLKKLIAAGFRVAVAEQLIDASQAKGIVPRAVTRVITPGTLVDETLIDPEAPGALAAVLFTASGDDSPAAVAVVEVSTGEFVVLSCGREGIVDELARRGAREVLYCDSGEGAPPARVKRVLEALRIPGTARPAWQFRPQEAFDALREQFGVTTLAGFGLADDAPEGVAAGAIVRYLRETQTISDEDARAAVGVRLTRATLKHLRPPRREQPDRYCVVDAVSLRSLEVERTLRDGGRGGEGGEGSLLSIFLGSGKRSCCRTAMGRRLLRDWLCRPLRVRGEIEARQKGVGVFVEDRRLAVQAGELLEGVQDTPRIGARLAMARVTPRDLVGLARSLDRARAIAGAMEGAPAFSHLHAAMARAVEAVEPLAKTILSACVDEPPPHLREGGVIRDGHDALLDEARLLQRDSTAWLAEYQKRLVEKHSLPGLKVGYNRVFGYYIELPSAQARQAPAELSRKQTLRNAERYTTPELAEFERKVTTAESRALERERELFAGLCDTAHAQLDAIDTFGRVAGELDAQLAFAEKAVQRGWKRPEMVDEPVLLIHAGRHPVLDESLGANFVPNDIELGELAGAVGEAAPNPAAGEAPTTFTHPRLALITGPNMAGKSTYIRQTALLCLLAHAGSFIPADRATIGVIDRIFTRIGADDALHAGQSTFMVEMIETANILNHATQRSLVVLDEVGRGTSTLDGLSLAWAVVEFLAAGSGPRTLFATHYHELTDLEERLPGRVKNLHVAVREWPGGGEHAEIVFLHRILPGRTDRSYGLHVARLAGIPSSVVSRGREVLASLAVHHTAPVGEGGGAGTKPIDRITTRIAAPPDGQFSLFTEFVPHPAVDALREIKLDGLTPLEAFDALRRLADLASRSAGE
ncbi:DNA mismatch repair protein MutS [Phycisphaerales bacterium]|nr:DNA mismatch repair protein MutS [Phycisphaerales bacterium]